MDDGEEGLCGVDDGWGGLCGVDDGGEAGGLHLQPARGCTHGTSLRSPAHRVWRERRVTSWGSRMAALRIAPSPPMCQPATGSSMRSLCGPAPKRLSVRPDPVKAFSASFGKTILPSRRPGGQAPPGGEQPYGCIRSRCASLKMTSQRPPRVPRTRQSSSLTERACSGSVASNMASQWI